MIIRILQYWITYLQFPRYNAWLLQYKHQSLKINYVNYLANTLVVHLRFFAGKCFK